MISIKYHTLGSSTSRYMHQHLQRHAALHVVGVCTPAGAWPKHSYRLSNNGSSYFHNILHIVENRLSQDGVRVALYSGRWWREQRRWREMSVEVFARTVWTDRANSAQWSVVYFVWKKSKVAWNDLMMSQYLGLIVGVVIICAWERECVYARSCVYLRRCLQ